jgi:hypothetical protein
MKVLIYLLAAINLAQQVQSDCRLQDITNILGGSDYEVLSIKTHHMTYSYYSFLVVTSTVHKTGWSSNTIFIYLLDYSICTVSFSWELVGFNQGIVDMASVGDKVAILGYDEQNSVLNEVIQICSVWYDGNLKLSTVETLTATIQASDKTALVSFEVTQPDQS